MTDPQINADFMEFLKSKSVAVLSTVAPDGQPESATVYFTVGDHMIFHVMTKTFSRKYANLETNPKVSLVVGTENQPVTAQVQGIAEKITDPQEFAKQLDLLEKNFLKNDFVAPLFQIAPEGKNTVVVYKITPTWIRWLDLRSEKGKVDGDFVQIIP